MRAPPRHSYPLAGHLPAFLADRLGFLNHAGGGRDVVALRIGKRSYLVNNPDDIRHVPLTNHGNYDKEPRLTSTTGKRLLGDGLLTSAVADVPRRRPLRPLFHREAVGELTELIVRRVDESVDGWSSGQEVDVSDHALALARRIVVSALLGGEADSVGAEFEQALARQRRRMDRALRSPVPLSTRLPPLSLGYRRTADQLHGVLDRAIRARRDGAARGRDMLSMLMVTADQHGNGADDEWVRREALGLAMAGHETVSRSLTWSWYLLASNPDAEARLLSEVDAVLESRAPSAASLQRLVYTEKVLAESMRLYPPTWMFVRKAGRDDVLPSGAKVRGGSKVILSPYVTHRDARYYRHPERFDPERFGDDAKRERPRFAYFPFGGGPRVCIGQPLAMVEGVLVLARLAQRFRLELPPGAAVTPEPAVTLRPKGGLPMIVRERD